MFSSLATLECFKKILLPARYLWCGAHTPVFFKSFHRWFFVQPMLRKTDLDNFLFLASRRWYDRTDQKTNKQKNLESLSIFVLQKSTSLRERFKVDTSPWTRKRQDIWKEGSYLPRKRRLRQKRERHSQRTMWGSRSQHWGSVVSLVSLDKGSQLHMMEALNHPHQGSH